MYEPVLKKVPVFIRDKNYNTFQVGELQWKGDRYHYLGPIPFVWNEQISRLFTCFCN